MKNIFKYFKRHARHYRAIIFCMLIFMFFSCGIPTAIYLADGVSDDYSYYEFSTTEEDDSFTTNLLFNLRDSSLTVEYDTPSLCYFYAIYPSNISISNEYFSNYICDEFDETYADQYPGKRLRSSEDDPYIIEYNVDDVDIKLYKFNYKDESNAFLDQEALSYLTTIKSLSYDTDYDVNFDIEYNSTNNNFDFNETDTTLYFETLNSDGSYFDSTDIQLNRYNGESFINSNISSGDLDYLCIDKDELNSNNVSYKVFVYTALTVEGDFTNIFWSNLHEVGSFDI